MPAARDLIQYLPGTFSRSDGLAVGLTLDQLRSRHLSVLTREVYQAVGPPSGLVDTCNALVQVMTSGAAFSHQTAAELLGLPDLGRRKQLLHVMTPIGSPPVRRPGIVGHRELLCPGDIAVAQGLPVTSPVRTFLDHAPVTSLEELIALGDAILHCKLATRAQLSARIAEAKGWRGVRNARAAVPLLDGRAESVPESLLRVRIHFSELPDAEPQVKVYDDYGNYVGRVDLGYKEMRIAIEYDGRHHAERRGQFDYDIKRYTLLESLGWHVLRAGGDDLDDGSIPFLGRLRRTIRHVTDH